MRRHVGIAAIGLALFGCTTAGSPQAPGPEKAPPRAHWLGIPWADPRYIDPHDPEARSIEDHIRDSAGLLEMDKTGMPGGT